MGNGVVSGLATKRAQRMAGHWGVYRGRLWRSSPPAQAELGRGTPILVRVGHPPFFLNILGNSARRMSVGIPPSSTPTQAELGWGTLILVRVGHPPFFLNILGNSARRMSVGIPPSSTPTQAELGWGTLILVRMGHPPGFCAFWAILLDEGLLVSHPRLRPPKQSLDGAPSFWLGWANRHPHSG